MKKRISAAFAVIALLVTFLTAGSRVMAAGAYSGMTEADAISEGQQFVTEINEIVSGGMAEMYGDGGVISAAFDSWAASLETLGEFSGFTGKNNAVINANDATINIGVQGTTGRTATVTIQLDEQGIASIMTNIDETMGEKVSHAALNTLLGMGMAFFVLILIALIIKYVFPPINRISAKREKKAAPAPAPLAAPAPQVAAVEEEVDDTELIAVIAAAVAAAEGRTGTDGFVVRSIRKSRNR